MVLSNRTKGHKWVGGVGGLHSSSENLAVRAWTDGEGHLPSKIKKMPKKGESEGRKHTKKAYQKPSYPKINFICFLFKEEKAHKKCTAKKGEKKKRFTRKMNAKKGGAEGDFVKMGRKEKYVEQKPCFWCGGIWALGSQRVLPCLEGYTHNKVALLLSKELHFLLRKSK